MNSIKDEVNNRVSKEMNNSLDIRGTGFKNKTEILGDDFMRSHREDF
jgi:hypothetical protein